MQYPIALLEDWMRQYYFATEIDLGSSGVQDFSLAEVRALTGLRLEELDRLVFHDGQSLGNAGLRRAIAGRWTAGDSDRVLVTHGSTEANFLVMSALLRPGDEVIALEPCYQQLFSVAEALGCRLRRWRLRPEDGFAPDLGELRRQIGPATRMIVVNFPHNPTGVTLTRREQAELLDCAADAGAWLVWDAAFAEITHGAPPLPDPTALYERAVSMGTLSKCYGLPGLRVGWCLAAPDVLERCVRIRDYTVLHLSPLVERVALAVVEHADRLVGLRRRQARSNLATVTAWAERHRDHVEWLPPAGGVCAFPRIRGVARTEELCHHLGRTHKVLLVPGSCFGSPDRVRLGFGGDPSSLQTGLGRLSLCLREELGRDLPAEIPSNEEVHHETTTAR